MQDKEKLELVLDLILEEENYSFEYNIDDSEEDTLLLITKCKTEDTQYTSTFAVDVISLKENEEISYEKVKEVLEEAFITMEYLENFYGNIMDKGEDE